MAHAPVTSDQWENYLQAPTCKARLATLQGWRQKNLSLPFSLCRDLLSLGLSSTEHMALMETCEPDSKIAFEFWIFDKLLQWNQALAGIALRTWADKTDCVLWHRLFPILRIPGLPQRIQYTILDIAPQCAGPEIVAFMIDSEGWEDFSPAYHALLFDRAIQFGVKSTRLTQIAWRIFGGSKDDAHPDDKSLLSACAWLMQNDEKKFKKILSETTPSVWQQMVRNTAESHSDRKRISERVAKKISKSSGSHTAEERSSIFDEWPAAWSRAETTEEAVRDFVTMGPNFAHHWLPGTPLTSVVEALATEPHNSVTDWVNVCGGQLPWPMMRNLIQKEVFKAPPTGRSAAISVPDNHPLHEERKSFQSPKSTITQHSLLKAGSLQLLLEGEKNSDTKPSTPMTAETFLSAMTTGSTATTGDNFWDQLARAWVKPSEVNVSALASLSRKHGGIATICYISTLGRMKGNDEAVLKLLDHIRSPEEDELRVIVRALGDIDTGRSLQELIAVITRPNATVGIQQDAVSILSRKDVSSLQKELKAAVQDLRIPVDPDSPLAEIREQLAGMIQTQAPKMAPTSTPGQPIPMSAVQLSDTSLDDELSRMIPHYRELSSEVRRALRTALFFNHTITGSEAANAIDLSPLIDMQYKAMELLFRESFEDAVTQSLHRGGIQRKLDVIGYARPIPQAMDEFENYIANLPMVREIPFFSKFKLRKMLRAICQFQPGRRFTLDGLKAFGLFFLCFGRNQCQFGLGNMFHIGAKDDLELAEFCKELHVFQDFRNRAAHEGFHPSASNDIQGIWRTTALIVQWAFRIRSVLNASKAVVHKRVS